MDAIRRASPVTLSGCGRYAPPTCRRPPAVCDRRDRPGRRRTPLGAHRARRGHRHARWPHGVDGAEGSRERRLGRPWPGAHGVFPSGPPSLSPVTAHASMPPAAARAWAQFGHGMDAGWATRPPGGDADDAAAGGQLQPVERAVDAVAGHRSSPVVCRCLGRFSRSRAFAMAFGTCLGRYAPLLRHAAIGLRLVGAFFAVVTSRLLGSAPGASAETDRLRSVG